ncbi:MAG: uncharacterized protein PWR13_256 [Archaeoglobi archaeon]|nr:DUF371 domain-containing protein [Candidatus Mnemosynella bozhongmuii]MDI3501947.1 uncharacterized protein [Archaeoglobi archaeon]MDK2781228.1 uncharacterized protein [Archaeoglobi archaeon]
MIRIRARGHENIRATHRTTLEITKDEACTPRGDCIVAVSSDRSARDLNDELREPQWLRVVLRVPSGKKEIIEGFYPGHELTDERSIVLRKSDFICGRTLMIRCSKSAGDLSRDFVKELQKGAEVEIEIISLS